jgi:hypothetical protein
MQVENQEHHLGGPVKGEHRSQRKHPPRSFADTPAVTNDWPWHNDPKAIATMVDTEQTMPPPGKKQPSQRLACKQIARGHRQLRFAPNPPTVSNATSRVSNRTQSGSCLGETPPRDPRLRKIRDPSHSRPVTNSPNPRSSRSQTAKRDTFAQSRRDTPGGEATPTRRNIRQE